MPPVDFKLNIATARTCACERRAKSEDLKSEERRAKRPAQRDMRWPKTEVCEAKASLSPEVRGR